MGRVATVGEFIGKLIMPISIIGAAVVVTEGKSIDLSLTNSPPPPPPN